MLDAFARAVVGWSMVNHQGSPYTSIAFGQHLREAGPLASMGSRGDAYDNATLRVVLREFGLRAAGPRGVQQPRAGSDGSLDYIECWYNSSRRHSSLCMLSPLDYERS